MAAAGAIVTLASWSNPILQTTKELFSLPALVVFWTIIVVQYFIIRSTLRAITDRTKWKTLNRIRDKMNTIEATGDLSDKDIAERLLRLADIHKQVMSSNTKTFDLKSVTTLFSQLMLPLLGLLLGNIEQVLGLFKK